MAVFKRLRKVNGLLKKDALEQRLSEKNGAVVIFGRTGRENNDGGQQEQFNI